MCKCVRVSIESEIHLIFSVHGSVSTMWNKYWLRRDMENKNEEKDIIYINFDIIWWTQQKKNSEILFFHIDRRCVHVFHRMIIACCAINVANILCSLYLKIKSNYEEETIQNQTFIILWKGFASFAWRAFFIKYCSVFFIFCSIKNHDLCFMSGLNSQCLLKICSRHLFRSQFAIFFHSIVFS